jgi:hypothetical protein
LRARIREARQARSFAVVAAFFLGAPMPQMQR